MNVLPSEPRIDMALAKEESVEALKLGALVIWADIASIYASFDPENVWARRKVHEGNGRTVARLSGSQRSTVVYGLRSALAGKNAR